MRANEAAFRAVTLRPRAGVAIAAPDLSTTVLGAKVTLPIMTAPCGGVAMVHPDGQRGVCDAATVVGTLATVSTLCGNDLDVPQPGPPGPHHWFQLYKVGGRSGAEILVDRARRAGYGALVVAVDTPVIGRKDRDLRHGGVKPGGATLTKIDLRSVLEFAPKVVGHPRWLARFARAGFPMGHPGLRHVVDDAGRPIPVDDALAQMRAEPAVWEDLTWIRDLWNGPLVVKGVMDADDASRAVDLGADAVVVSNHGGRQLDRSPATLRVLPAVVAAVGERVEVYLDGGVRRGVDAAIAVALGARAVFVGRPYLYGLAVGGASGVESVLRTLEAELVNSMVLMGYDRLADLDPKAVLSAGDPTNA
jgi:isopentenyl diphosphate isomerase/L-lactate dehydrogenase-like FMN-dependent dehydrogenase